MKRLQILLWVLSAVITLNAAEFGGRPGEKTAILMVHFGTTFDDTRAATIDCLNNRVKAAFPDVHVAEAYSSRIIINRLRKRGVEKLNPQEALLRLAADGYTHVIVQGSNVIEGIETEVLRAEATRMAPFFTEIRVGHPLLYSVDDCMQVVTILKDRYSHLTGKDRAVVLIGHGTSTPATAIYSQIDYMFTAAGAPQFHVATVEGYPTYETTLARLKADKVRKVTLLPFMFVAGDHARNDIDTDWRENLQDNGMSASTLFESLGSIPEIQDLYIDHIKAAFEGPLPNAASTKAASIISSIR